MLIRLGGNRSWQLYSIIGVDKRAPDDFWPRSDGDFLVSVWYFTDFNQPDAYGRCGWVGFVAHATEGSPIWVCPD